MIATACEPEVHRYTLDGSEALEQLLRETCRRVGREIQALVPASRLEGVLLGGGYGRGEGGVLQGQGGDQPYNDLDFYVFLKGSRLLNARIFGPQLHHLAETLSRESGIEIELKLDSLSRWARLPVSMFSYDVLMGHKWLVGDDSLFARSEQHTNAAAIPASEAARLMLNRCSGLLFAAEHLERDDFTLEAADFAARNIAKAQLGIGDAVLTMAGQYHWSCAERHERLTALHLEAAWYAGLIVHHAAGVEFKLHPKRSAESRTALREAHAEVASLALKVWLWLESRRLKVPFTSVAEYSHSRVNKCPETKPWRNALINARQRLPGQIWRYPRERLFHALPLLLWERGRIAEFIPLLQRKLRTRARDFRSLAGDYQDLWRRFN